MLQRLYLLIAPTLVFILIACAPTPQNHIDFGARGYFETVDAYLIVPQKKLDLRPDVSQSNSSTPATGSLISEFIALGVMANEIEKQKDPNAEKTTLLEPLQESMGDYDFAELLLENIDSKLQRIHWLNAKDLILIRDVERNLYSKKCRSSSASANLFIAADYWISEDISRLYTRAELFMFPNTPELSHFKAKQDDNNSPANDTDNIYHNILTVSVPLKIEGLVKNRTKILAANGAEKIKSALTVAAEEVSAYIERDIEIMD